MTLRERVAQAITTPLAGWCFDERPEVDGTVQAVADAAIRVVLGVVADEIKALPDEDLSLYHNAARFKSAVLAVVERLGAVPGGE